MSVLGALEPARVMHYFEEICGIPHGSGNTKKISDYCVSFAKEHHLTYLQDEYNNVIIWKDGIKGYENSAPVMLQGIWIWSVKKKRAVTLILRRMDFVCRWKMAL
ncbi:MAG: hypothetical protein ACLSD6_01280 [Clostridium sp.]